MSVADYHNRRSLELILDGARWSVATFGHWTVIWLLIWILADVVGRTRSILWGVVISSVLLFQACFALYWHQDRIARLDTQGVQTQLRIFTTSAWLIGLCWAAGSVVLFPENNRESQLFLVFVMGGMSLAAVGTQHVYLPACYGSMGIALPILAARYGLDGRWVECSLLMLYTIVILRLARMLSRFSMQTIGLQFERDQLLEQLTLRANDLERARADADEANLAKSRFLAQASHDLRQPLHAIGLFIESLSDAPAASGSSTAMKQLTDRMRDSIGMLSNLFDSLLDVTVLDAGNTEPVPIAFKLNDIYSQLQRDFAPIAEAHNVILRFRPTRAVVETDPILLRRLIQNLVSNAIRHTHGGKVLVGTRRCGKTLAVDVIDNGSGIPAHEQQRIFQEFVKLKHPQSADVAGMGLGLAIVRRLASVLDLNVTLTSTVGEGTRFRIADLQPGTNPVRTLLEEERDMSTDWLRDTRVLVVDDDTEVLDATTNLLSKWGCSVISAEAFPSPVPEVDVILSDYELQTVDGLQKLQDIKRDRPEVLTVLISGNSSLELRNAADTAGIPLLHKPVRPVKLRSLLLQLATQAA